MVVVVVPHRNRTSQLARLVPCLAALGSVDRVIVVEPVDDGRPFNRGWVKNVGFLLANANDTDTVYFHDVDLLPQMYFLSYPATVRGKVQHLYGHPHCLGGIVGMQAFDFSRVQGFVNDREEWGGEDRYLRQACEFRGLIVPKAPFCPRFYNDNYISEMDDQGRPQAGYQAMAVFRQQLRQKKKVCAPSRCMAVGDLPATRFATVELRYHKKYPKVTWAIVQAV